MKQTVKFLAAALIFFATVVASHAYPPLPTEFYGEVVYFNGQGPINRIVRAYDPTNTQCGIFSTKIPGFYGVISCRGDYNDTFTDEGAVVGEQITFFFGNEEATAIGDATYTPSQFKNVTLIIPKIVCGDHFCQIKYENCAGCPADCGVCQPPNISPPPPNLSKIPPSGGGGGGGDITPPGNLQGLSEMPFNVTPCEELWNCTDWSECFANETQTRLCIDENQCKTTRKKPPELQECIYEGNCVDGIKNGKETGIDCGGPCRPCPGQEGEPNCFDGIKNCHDGECEDGVDCGGVCENDCERQKKLEAPLRICNRPTEIFRIDFLLLYVLVALFSAAYIFLEKEREKKIKNNKDLKETEKVRKYLITEKSIILFVIFVILLLASIIMYYIFFYCSKNFYSFLKFLIPALILIPIIAFYLMKTFEYNEKERKRKLERFLDTHLLHIKKLIMMQNEYLQEFEVQISNDIYQLSNKKEFKEYLETYPRIKTVYRDLLVLYDKYKEQKNAMGIEKELCDNIRALEGNTHFQKLANDHVEIKSIYEKFESLYKAYEEKQELYDELKKEEDEILRREKEEREHERLEKERKLKEKKEKEEIRFE